MNRIERIILIVSDSVGCGEPFEMRIGRRTRGNYSASGTEVVKQLGEEYIKTGRF
jgi:phosphopentomutase